MSRFAGLKEDLENNGWEISDVELPSDAWWAFAIWQLHSTWRPVGRTLHLVLMLDPMLSYERKPPSENDVWSVAIADQLPSNRMCASIAHEIHTNRKLTERCREIVAAATKLRDN